MEVCLILIRAAPLADPYQHAAATLGAWFAEGILATDPTPSFYGYRMHFTDADDADRQTVGVIGALVLPHGEGDVFRHERTLPKARSDRLALLRATRANFDPSCPLSLAEALNPPFAPHPAPVSTAV